jgi:predicted DCC family thiol-disulfide oxidoreductase YuxK
VILYDATCALCNALVQFVLVRDRRELFHFAALQNNLGQSLARRFGRDPGQLDTFYVVVDYRSAAPALLDRARAVLFVARSLGGPWRLLALAGILPRAILDPVYGLIARLRYRFFGRRARCLTPASTYRRRFPDL